MRARPSRLAFGLLALLAVAASAAAATDPGLPGPFTPGILTTSIPATQGASLASDIHFPDDGSGGVDPAAGACPVVVFGHGFSRTKARYVDLGRHLASRGYVVVIPNFAGFADHSRNADDLSACVDFVLAENASPSSRFFGRIDEDAIGSSGHSAGGLSSLVALARDPRLKASAPLDPVDNGGLGVAALATVSRPVAITDSEPSACNADGSARDLLAAANAPRRGVRIIGANHCDPEMPSEFLCGLTCGAANAARQALYRKVVTGWLEMYLRCDPSYEPWVSGAEMQADVAAGLVSYEALPDPPPLPCTGAPPDEVTGLRVAKSPSGDDAVLTWDPAIATPEVLEYRVYRDQDPRFAAAPPPGVTPTVSFVDPLVLRDGVPLWFYQVRAVNAAGEGP